MSIYLDNSATTPLCSEAKNAVISALDDSFANPSSLHHRGINALSLLENSRKSVSDKLGCSPEEIYFTAGGTYSNNIAVFGAVSALRRKGNKIITSAVEHPSVENVMKKLENDGFNVVRIPVDCFGNVNKADIINEIDDKTILVSMMLVNNELGSILPVRDIKKYITMKKSPALLHCDAVQGFGKININAKTFGADLISVSSHKIHGPKGAGALYIKKGTRIVSPLLGGGQEKDISPGTQALPAIAGFGAAAEMLEKDCSQSLEKAKELRDYLVNELKKIDSVYINSGDDALPYIVNISVLGIPSQPMINFLSENGICVSGGSACSKGHRSSVLSNTGLSSERIDSAIRISMSRYTTKDELTTLVQFIDKATKTLRKSR